MTGKIQWRVIAGSDENTVVRSGETTTPIEEIKRWSGKDFGIWADGNEPRDGYQLQLMSNCRWVNMGQLQLEFKLPDFREVHTAAVRHFGDDAAAALEAAAPFAE